ncbi:MAG: hypothetical protein QOE95_504 [Gaiellaceae bacterium]|jgi:hypothetical protein|nr:hypothetical protein [Gaiellaceae bacterium]
MKPLLIKSLVCALLGLAFAVPAFAGDFGVTDDGGKFSPSPAAAENFYARAEALGLKQNTFTVPFDPANPTGIVHADMIQQALEAAARHHVKIVFEVGTGKARTITGNPFGAAQYIAYLQTLVRHFPTVTDYIVGNEGNVWRFWQPQYNSRCRPIAGAIYERLLAASYDTLKGANPQIQVIGVGLSPRGNDNCHARSNISTSPVHYLANMGASYRASGRTTPIMDALSFHPYPQSNTDSLAVGYRYPNAGVINLDRIKQAFWDAFHGTGQPTFLEGLPLPSPPPGPTSLPPAFAPEHATFVLDEVGWQAKVPGQASSAYRGRENVRLVSEAKQAQIYGQLVHLANCDPSIQSLNYFHLDDEADRDRFQSGLFRADLTARPAAAVVRTAIAADDGRCSGREALWRHATGVVGARTQFTSGGSVAFTARAEEAATYSAGVFDAATLPPRDELLLGSDASGWALASELTASGSLQPYRPMAFRLGAPLPRGTYVYAIRMRAQFNPERSSLFVSPPVSIP